MSRQELAEIVNAVVARDHGRHGVLDATYIGKLERGSHRWPNDQYRAAFRTALGAACDADLGFYIIRGDSRIGGGTLPLTTGHHGSAAGSRSDPIGDPNDLHLDTSLGLCAHVDEDVVDVLSRVHRLNRTLDPAVIDHLKSGLQHTLANYDAADHSPPW